MKNIQYQRLPQFDFNQVIPNYNESAINGIIKSNDLKLSYYLDNKITKKQFFENVKLNTSLLKERILVNVSDNETLFRWLERIIDLSEEVFLYEQLAYLSKKVEIQSKDININKHVDNLKKNGLTKLVFNDKDLIKIKSFIQKIPFEQQSRNRFFPSKFNFFLNKLIKVNKIEKIGSIYSNTKMISHPNYTIRFVENHEPNHYASINKSVTHPLDDLHLDRFAPSLTLIIYLSDVNKNDGPFQYIEGSNNQKISQFLRSVSVAVTYAKIPKSDYFNCEVEDDRKLFMQIPECFRKLLVVGTYLTKNSNLYNSYLKKLNLVTRPIGSAILFDGYKTLHTGGRPINGKRLSLFQALTPSYKLYRRLNY